MFPTPISLASSWCSIMLTNVPHALMTEALRSQYRVWKQVETAVHDMSRGLDMRRCPFWAATRQMENRDSFCNTCWTASKFASRFPVCWIFSNRDSIVSVFSTFVILNFLWNFRIVLRILWSSQWICNL